MDRLIELLTARQGDGNKINAAKVAPWRTGKRDTLSDVLVDMMLNGVTACALIRPRCDHYNYSDCDRHLNGCPQEAIAVIMIDTPAIKRIGDALMEVIDLLPTCPSELPPVDEDVRLKAFFELVDHVAQGWLGFGMRFGSTTICVMMFRGEPCKRIAEICTAHGAPCFLDPDKPVPGYEIEGRAAK